MVLPDEMLRLAEHIIETKAGDFDPVVLEDHYRNAMVQMLRQKQTQHTPRQAGRVKPSRENVISIMDSLKRSLAAETTNLKPPKTAAASSKAAAKKSTGRSRRAG